MYKKKKEYILIKHKGKEYKQEVDAYNFKYYINSFYYKKDDRYILVDTLTGLEIINSKRLKDLYDMFDIIKEQIDMIRHSSWYEKEIIKFNKLGILKINIL